MTHQCKGDETRLANRLVTRPRRNLLSNFFGTLRADGAARAVKLKVSFDLPMQLSLACPKLSVNPPKGLPVVNGFS